jgi:archaellum component FlaC
MMEKYKWVYKLFKQTDLNKMESGDTESDADGRRATKQDVQSAVAKVRKENAEMKKENAEIKSSIEGIKKENGEIKSTLERIEKDNKVALETIMSLVSSLRPP